MKCSVFKLLCLLFNVHESIIFHQYFIASLPVEKCGHNRDSNKIYARVRIATVLSHHATISRRLSENKL